MSYHLVGVCADNSPPTYPIFSGNDTFSDTAKVTSFGYTNLPGGSFVHFISFKK